MEKLVARYLAPLQNRKLRVLDIGSCDINGSYRPLFQRPNWHYQGVDLSPGPNVDIALANPYRWQGIKTCSVDVVISGQAFEHIEFFWLTWREMVRVLKPSGLIFLIAPSRGPEHRHPVDCWRFYPDGFRALAKYCDMELLEVSTDWENVPQTDNTWGDTVGVFRRPQLRAMSLRQCLVSQLRQLRLPGYWFQLL
jgi:SAM-dependent methyltransferase